MSRTFARTGKTQESLVSGVWESEGSPAKNPERREEKRRSNIVTVFLIQDLRFSQPWLYNGI
jgi:hypothetical protein